MLERFDQYVADKILIYIKTRWAIAGFLAFVYVSRVIINGSHVVVSYVAGVYLLHSFVSFMTPDDENIPDPFDADYQDTYVPNNIDNDYKPYVRKLPEYTLWVFTIQILVIIIILSMFEFADIPVFSPILISYFIFMLVVTLYTVISHSKKYKYNLLFFDKAKINKE